MKNLAPITLALALLTPACSNAPTTYYCRRAGDPACLEFGDGWTPEDADDACPPEATFAPGVCASGGGLGRCIVTMGTQTATYYYYATFGDGTVAYAEMTCDYLGGSFSPL